MTSVATTSYRAAANRYGAAEKSVSGNAADTYADFSDSQPGNTGATDTALPSAAGPNVTVDSRPSTATANFQGKLLNINLIDTSKLKKINVAELPEEQYQAFMEQDKRIIAANKEYLEHQYTSYTEPDYSNDPRMKPYATITVGGRVVATIDNQGVVGSDSMLGARIQGILVGDVNGTNGPDLAQARAEQLAALMGGRIVKSNTAITQNNFNALPPFEQPKATINYEAMKQDPLYQWLQNMTANVESTKQNRAEYLASLPEK